MGNLQVEYSVTMGGDGESEVELHDMAPAWLPEEGGHVFGTMLVKGAKEAESFRFTLYDVSSEPGDCCNSPDDNTRPDLCFAENQEGWSIRQEGDKWVATSAEGGKTASIRINCLDWGAWGKLKGEALIQGQRKQARVDGGSDFIRIPYDQNDDHIADFWQKKKGVFDKPATDDSDGEYTGHAILGDGLSVYEEYRGFYIGSAADLTYVRLDPKQQQLFVLDRTGYFDPERAGIAHLEVYMLSEGLCEEGTSADASGIVNFRSSYARNGVKYCAVLTDAVGSGKDPELGETTWPNHGLRDVQYCRVFSRNAKEGLTLLANKVHYALRDPESQPAREFAAMGISRRVLQLADTQFWDEANRSEWSGSLLRWAALQQVLTACAVPTHAPGATTSPCFMKFRARWPDITLPLLQAMTDRRLRPDKMDYLCGRDAINCQGHVNVKDN